MRDLPVRHLLFVGICTWLALWQWSTRHVYAVAPSISNISDNRSTYGGTIPRYEKFEITFDLTTQATNTLWPYVSPVPPGIPSATGVTVNAIFTSPDNELYTQPGFYYQEFTEDSTVVGGNDWIYPTSQYQWKIRFAPHQAGTWKYRLSVQDAGGQSESSEVSFVVTESSNKGFIRVSTRDPRYFEYEDGTYFPALGYNLNGRRIDWMNPSKNEAIFQTLQQSNIQLIRHWLSQWSIFGSAWSPWKSINIAHRAQEPDVRLRHDTVIPFANGSPVARLGSDVFLWLSQDRSGTVGQKWNFTPCVVYGWENHKIPLKRNTPYRIRVRFKDNNIVGPEVNGNPYGFVMKYGGFYDWRDDNNPDNDCYSSANGTVLAASYGVGTVTNDPTYPDWNMLEHTYSNTTLDFFDHLYLAIQNATAGDVYVDTVWIEEILGDGQFGPNAIPKPWMAQHQYIDQRESYVLDKTLEYARAHDVYLKLVILEKKDYTLNIFNTDGTTSTLLPKDLDHILFYGNGRETTGKTKTRFLEEAWWRYLQARWGYSPNIHSWELLNEGNPGQGVHWILADELGKFMHQFTANKHLVTTSFFSGFAESGWNFFKSTNYPDVDYADTHIYAEEDLVSTPYTGGEYFDAALFHEKLSSYRGAKASNGPGKPVMRGETAWLFASASADLFAQNVTDGVWLHNFIWAGVSPGGLIESFWVGGPTQDQIYKTGSHDHRPMFQTYYNFIKDIPLNNGHYVDAQAQTDNTNLRAWGQIDAQNQRAHLWIHNATHTWKNVQNTLVQPVSGAVTLSGFPASTTLSVEWWDTYTGSVTQTESRQTNASGALILNVALGTSATSAQKPDLAIRIGSTGVPIILGDVDNDGDVDIFDYTKLLENFGQTQCGAIGDIDNNCAVDIFDYTKLLENFGKTTV